MVKNRPRTPIGLPLSAAVVFILGLIAQSVIRSSVSEEQLADNAILGGIPFILIFISIILTFITLIVWASRWLSNRIAARPYRLIEGVFIAGIVLGVIGMFQPWVFIAFRAGFIVLLVSTLGFIFWSHITPANTETQEEPERMHRAEIQ